MSSSTGSDTTIRSTRVAIIGYGLAGAVFHAPLISSTPGMTVAAIVTSNPERQEQAHRDFPKAAILSSAGQADTARCARTLRKLSSFGILPRGGRAG